jgi:hypothetical protein
MPDRPEMPVSVGVCLAECVYFAFDIIEIRYVKSMRSRPLFFKCWVNGVFISAIYLYHSSRRSSCIYCMLLHMILTVLF